MNESLLRYKDERDKSYGIAGMAITLVACNGEDKLSEINIDAEPGECMVMNHEFGFKGSPAMSARFVWEETLKDLRLTTLMALGNISCRRRILEHSRLSSKLTEKIHKAVIDEAREHCNLEKDEAERLFDSCMQYVDRIFSHAIIPSIATNFANEIAERRSMTVTEATELLGRLGLR